MKKILLSFLSFLFVLGIGVGLSQFGIFKGENKVKAAEDVFVMEEGASFRNYWTTPNCGITFGATISDTNPYVNNVRLFIAPYDFVETVLQRKTVIQDYIEAFNTNYNLTTQNQAKMPVENSYYTIVEPAIYKYSDVVAYKGGLKNIQAGNENRRFFGIYYYYDTSAGKNVYATMPNGEVGQARSIAYLASGHYNNIHEEDGVVTNDEYMTTFWMERAIKTAVSKSNGKVVEGNENETVDISSISYIEGENKTATILGGILSGTYFDDFLTISGTIVQVGDKEINVGQRLNFKVDYTNFSDYINQNGKKGYLVNITNAGSKNSESKIGRDTASYSLTINPYNLANATFTSQNVSNSFIDTLNVNGTTVTDTYTSGNYDSNKTPNLTLSVPKANNMLSAKTFSNDEISIMGTLTFSYDTNGENGNLQDASVDIKPNLTAKITGSNFNNTYKQAITSFTKDKFGLNVAYVYGTNYEDKTNKDSITTGIIDKKYYYKQTYSYTSPSVTGYTPESNVSGTFDAKGISHTVKYNANPYNVSYDYNGGTKGSTNPTTATYGRAFTVSSPTKSGYKFAGWQVANVNVDTALYGNSATQNEKVLSDLSRCYQKNTSDLDYNNSAYWTADVYFKNLTATNNATITLKANWTYIGKIADANDSASVINTANDTIVNSKVIEIANGVTGDFILTFSYYQNAIIDETNLAYSSTCWRTGILGIGKYTDWGYYNHIRQDAYSWQGTNPIGGVSSPSDYTASNNYYEMFYGLVGNDSNATTTKFAEFVRNSLVEYKIVGKKVGQVGGSLQITQTITSLGEKYKNQTISIVYDINLTDGILLNTGLDICVNAEDAELSFESLSYVITADGYTYNAKDTETYGTLVDGYKHYAPDKYWAGDFDFTFSYNQTQANYFSIWEDTCWRTGYVVFYEWGNTAEHILFRNDWHGQIGSSTTKITFDNAAVKSIADLHTATSGKATSYGGTKTNELRLFRNASITVRCTRVGNTVTVYQFVSTPGSSQVVLYNIYKFTTTISNLSFQIVGRSSGVTITYEDYSANTKVLTNTSLGATTYGLGTYCFTGPNTSRVHMALPMPVKAGTVVKFKGDTTYLFSVLEMTAFLGAYDGIDHASNIIYDTTWIDTTKTKSYTVSRDCYIAINLRKSDNASLQSADILKLFKDCIEIVLNFTNNLNKNEKTFTSSMMQDNTTYGLTTYSGQFGEGNARCHIAVIPLIKKGTVITFKGGANYNWSVLEMASERVILHDTTWLDPATTTTYTVSRDCYIAVNVKYADNTTAFNESSIKTFLYNNIKIEGKCGVIYCEDDATYSATEPGDMQSINHRGFSADAPENTLAAYSVSKQKGFTKVECDINFTKDGYGVLLHDGSINRTTGQAHKGNISDINFKDVRSYDFGTWKNTKYANEQMPTVEEFLLQCKNLSLHPYLELKYGTKAQIQRLAMLVRRLGMEDNVTWISFDLNCLTYVRDVSPGARLGFLHNDINQDVINSALSLRTGKNEVFLDINYGCVDTVSEASSRVALCKANNLPLEVWTVNNETTMKNVYNATGGYVTGFTSDNTIAENVKFS